MTRSQSLPEILLTVELLGGGVADNLAVCRLFNHRLLPEGVGHRFESQTDEEGFGQSEHSLGGVVL